MSLNTVAVVGMGPSGLSIAQATAEADINVIAVCVTSARPVLARRRMNKTLEMRIERGELTRREADELLARVTFTTDLARARTCDLVIESTVGDVRSRRALLATIESTISRGSVLASNSVRAELPQIAEALVRKDQFLGLRFFHPATHTSLVEVISLPETAPGARFACEAFCRWLGKTSVEQVDGALEPAPGHIAASI